MAEDKTKTKFSTTVVALTGLISAIGGIITVLFNTGVLGGEKKEVQKTKEPPVVVVKEKPKMKDVTTKKLEPDYIEQPKKRSYNLTGYWIDNNNPNGKYYFHQQNEREISFTEYSLLFGQWITSATGSGTIDKDNIKLVYSTSSGTTGEFIGNLYKEGNVIGGTVRDLVTGLTGTLHLKKE